MDLKSGYPFWLLKDGLMASYPKLGQNLKCEVAIIGGGITGALVAYYLTQAGVDAVLVDKRDIGQGSTSASTALLLYEVDTHLSKLINLVGEVHAVRSYMLCVEAITQMEQLVHELGDDCEFMRKKSLYFASRKQDVAELKNEYHTRRRHGIRLDFLDQTEIKNLFSFRAPAALWSHEAAQLNPYRLTHRLLQKAVQQGLRVYDRTEVIKFQSNQRGVVLATREKFRLTSKKVVFATGYESYLKKKVAQLRNTYALVTEPLENFSGWHEQCLVWETARPYFYLRPTSEGRAIMGGEDDYFHNPDKRDRALHKKAVKLQKRFQTLFPRIPVEIAYAWAGTFAETEDGLAYIGETREFPHGYFALGYGGNGITYSIIAARIIRDLFLGRENHDKEIFRFDR